MQNIVNDVMQILCIFYVSFRAVGTFARALDCSSSIRQPSLHMSAAAASRDITLVRQSACGHTFLFTRTSDVYTVPSVYSSTPWTLCRRTAMTLPRPCPHWCRRVARCCAEMRWKSGVHQKPCCLKRLWKNMARTSMISAKIL